MAVRFNHTIVHCSSKTRSADFLATTLGLPAPTPFGAFMMVRLDDGSSLDFIDAGDFTFNTQHYAFLVGEEDFDAIFARIRQRKIPYSADPFGKHPNAINHHDGGRGVYFTDPDGHVLEIITRPYGSAP